VTDISATDIYLTSPIFTTKRRLWPIEAGAGGIGQAAPVAGIDPNPPWTVEDNGACFIVL